VAHTALILGGGVGGLITANELRKRAGKDDRIIVIDRHETHVFQPSLLWVASGLRKPDQIRRPLQALLARGVKFERGDVQSIDAVARSVTVDGNVLQGDALVIALGAELAPHAIPGLAQGGHNFYTMAGAQSLHDALQSIKSGKLVLLTAAPAYKCPAAPYEMAMLAESVLRKRGVRSNVAVEMYAPSRVR
jgi:sulfide:quinone oxidoreductase